MKKSWLLAISITLVAAIAGLCGCSCGRATLAELPSGLEVNLNSQQEGIWVSGDGEVTAIPDIANLRLGIEAQETTVAEAKAQAAQAMDRVMNALTSNGVADKDIQTQHLSIYQVTRWDRDKEEEVVIGYRVTNMVTAKIRDIDKVSAIIDDTAEAGGDLARIDSLSFSIDDPSAYYGDARKEAMADAKAKAEQLADLAGVKLGKPTYISESLYTPPIIYPRAAYEEAIPGEASSPTPISPGEIEISLTIQVAYSILQ